MRQTPRTDKSTFTDTSLPALWIGRVGIYGAIVPEKYFVALQFHDNKASSLPPSESLSNQFRLHRLGIPRITGNPRMSCSCSVGTAMMQIVVQARRCPFLLRTPVMRPPWDRFNCSTASVSVRRSCFNFNHGFSFLFASVTEWVVIKVKIYENRTKSICFGCPSRAG
jgi:hypothetical protein